MFGNFVNSGSHILHFWRPYTADGFGGNFIVVDKDRDIVIVARWLEPSKLGELIKMVIGAVESELAHRK